MRTYNFRETNSQEGSLVTMVKKTNPFIQFRVNTQVVVSKDKWSVAMSKSKQMPMLDRLQIAFGVADGKVIYEQLTLVEDIIDDTMSKPESKDDKGNWDSEFIRTTISRAIKLLIAEPIRKAREERLKALMRQAQEQEQDTHISLISFLHTFSEEIQEGGLSNKNKQYGNGTKKVWKTFESVLEGFYDTRSFDWEDVNRSLVQRFVVHLSKSYALTTINKHITNFRRFLFVAGERQLHTLDVSAIFKGQKLAEEQEEKKIEVYLNEDELQALYEMRLEGRKELSRDIFLIGCYTAQAFADVSKIDRSIIFGDDKDVIRLKRQKTGTSARIPLDLQFKHNNLIPLLEKYNYDIKSLKIYDTKINKDIKEILQELSVSVPSLAEQCVTILTKTEKALEEEGKRVFTRNADGEVIKPKYECVSTHTARRSGITNLVLTDKYSLYKIQQIAGHSSVDQTEQYIKLSGEDIAEHIAKKSDRNV